MTNQTVDSASDARTVNNVMRHEYRVLSDVEKKQMKDIKDTGSEFLGQLQGIARYGGHDMPGRESRELEIAKTKIEEAVMWAVKHITR